MLLAQFRNPSIATDSSNFFKTFKLDIDSTAKFPVKLTMNMDSSIFQESLITSINRLDKAVYLSVQCYPNSKYQLYGAVGATLVSVD